MRFLCIVIPALYAVELIVASTRNNVEMNAELRVNPSFLEFVKQGLDEELESGNFRKNNEEGVGPIMEVVKDNALHELLQEMEPEVASGGVPLVEQIFKFEKRAQEKGFDSIQAIANHVEKKLNLAHADLTPIVNNIYSDYKAMLRRYLSDISKERPKCELDKEYIILDMVNVVSLIRSKIQKSLLENILALATHTDPDEKELLSGTIQIFNEDDKRQEIDFMCANFKVCRPNPPFSEYLFRLMDQTSKLNDLKFKYFFTRGSQLLLKKHLLFATVFRHEVFAFLQTILGNMESVEINELRRFVSFLHSIVLRRYKINRTKDKILEVKAKSAYIILDILDAALGIDGYEVYGAEMERTITFISEWSANIANDVEKVLYNLVEYIVEAINYNLSKRAKDEIMVLADILFYDKPQKQNGTEYLLTEGSKFVKGLLHRPEPKKLW